MQNVESQGEIFAMKLDANSLPLLLVALVVSVFYSLTWVFGPVGADTLPLLMSFGDGQTLTSVLRAPLLGSNADFSAGPYWRPLSNLFYWQIGSRDAGSGLWMVFILGFAVHCATSFLGAAMIRLILPTPPLIVWAALIFVHPVAADLLPAISRYQDLFGTLFAAAAGYALAVKHRPWLALGLASVAPFFKELYLVAPIAVSATIFVSDLVSRKTLRLPLVLGGAVAAGGAILLRLAVGVDLPQGDGGGGGVGPIVVGVTKVVLALLVPTFNAKLSALLAVVFMGLLAARVLRAATGLLPPRLSPSGLTAALYLGFLTLGTLSMMVAAGNLALRSAYVLAAPSVAVWGYTLSGLGRQSMTFRIGVLALALLFAGASSLAIRDWRQCDDVWNQLYSGLAQAGPEPISILRADVYYPQQKLSTNPSCIMRYTLQPLEHAQKNIQVSPEGYESVPVDRAKVSWDPQGRVISFR